MIDAKLMLEGKISSSIIFSFLNIFILNDFL
jgi:hypothetical protein